MNSTIEIFSKRLNLALKERNIKQKQLAETVGVQPATISTYLRKENPKVPNITIVIDIANYLDVSIDWLCGLEKKQLTSNYGLDFANVMREFDGKIISVKDNECTITFSNKNTIIFLKKYKEMQDIKNISDEIRELIITGLIESMVNISD